MTATHLLGLECTISSKRHICLIEVRGDNRGLHKSISPCTTCPIWRLQLIQTQQNWTQTTRKQCPAASKRTTHHIIKLQSSPSGNTGNHQKPTGGHQHTSACVSLICPNLTNIKKAQFGGASVTLERTASKISFRPQQLQEPGKLLHHVTPQ